MKKQNDKDKEEILKEIDNLKLLDTYRIALSIIDKVETYAWEFGMRLKEEGIISLKYEVKEEYLSFNGINWDLSDNGYIAYEYTEVEYKDSPYYIKVPAEVAFDSNKWGEYIEKEKKVNIEKQ